MPKRKLTCRRPDREERHTPIVEVLPKRRGRAGANRSNRLSAERLAAEAQWREVTRQTVQQ